MAIKTVKSELESIRDILSRCDIQIESTQEDLEELHIIEQHRKTKAEQRPDSHTKARHLIAVERIEVANASIEALNKTKENYKKRLRELVGDIKKVIRASHAAVVEATAAEANDSAAPVQD